MNSPSMKHPCSRYAATVQALRRLKPLLSTLCALAIYWGISSLAMPTALAQASPDIPDAPIENDEGGAIRITGQVTYTYAYFALGVDQPTIALLDHAGFVDRDPHFVAPIESQVLGQFLSDFRRSPFTYTLALPIEPVGELRDVDGDDQQDRGVMTFVIAFDFNLFGDAYMDARDQLAYNWPFNHHSTRVAMNWEIIGGKLLVYAPDDQQRFPADFGEDGRLFTGDEPVVRLPQGYTVVDLDASPFRFDRSRYPTIPLVEQKLVETPDLSGLSYTDAFDQLIEFLRVHYAFTQEKGIDWEALHATFRPQIEQAERHQDSLAYRRALAALAMSIPDGHMSGSIPEDWSERTAGGVGLSLCKTHDGRILISHILPDSPASQAGIQRGAELIAINDVPVAQYVSEIKPIRNASTAHVRELNQLYLAPLAPVGTKMDIEFANPDAVDSPQTVSLTSVAGNALFACVSDNWLVHGYSDVMPIGAYFTYDNRYRYVISNDFAYELRLTVRLWERVITSLNNGNGEGLIIDLRQNNGGLGPLATHMLAYLLSEPFDAFGYSLPLSDSDALPPESLTVIDRIVPVPPEMRYDGPVAVLIGPYCQSACEEFAYIVKTTGRGAVIGAYPTAGMMGSLNHVNMPEGVEFLYTYTRIVDPSGQVIVEGTGVEPTIMVPIDEDTLFSETDPLEDAAITYFEGLSTEAPSIDISDQD